jgi:uncharacterized membrane protein
MNQHISTHPDKPTRRHWLRTLPLPLLEAGLLLTWSSGFIGARFSIDYAPALLVVFWRCVVVSLVLLPFVYRTLRSTSFSILLKNAGIGLLAMAGYLTGVTQGIALGVPAGLAALCADLLPLGMALLAALALGERLARQVWVGLIVGLVGVLWVTHGALVMAMHRCGPTACRWRECSLWQWQRCGKRTPARRRRWGCCPTSGSSASYRVLPSPPSRAARAVFYRSPRRVSL